MWGSESYYDKPWEITADLYGGVVSRTPDASKIKKGDLYLKLAKKYGILSWVLAY